jgi:hypothetical protein
MAINYDQRLLVPNLCASLRPGTRNIGEKYAKFRVLRRRGELRALSRIGASLLRARIKS